MVSDTSGISDEAARIERRTVGEISLDRYEDGDVVIHGKGGGVSESPDRTIPLTPPQLGVLAREWPLEPEESLNLGTGSLDGPISLTREDGEVELSNPELTVAIQIEGVEELVELLRGWNYHQYRDPRSEVVELDADHVESLLNFVWDHHPRNSTGWVGDLAEALVDAQTSLYNGQISVPREPLATLVEWADEGTNHPATKGAAGEIDHSLSDFGSERIAVDECNVERLVDRIRHDGSFNSVDVGDDVTDALVEVESALDE